MMLAAAIFLTCMPIALLDFAVPTWRSNDAVRVGDAYKHLYQATMGGEHAVTDRDSAFARLEAEWLEIGDSTSAENLWEALCPDGSIGRVNLRPYKRGGGKQRDLIDAFLASSREFNPDKDKFLTAWAELGSRLKKENIGKLDHKSWMKFDAEMKKKNYPAVSHSEEYRRSKRPAYRVLTLLWAQEIIPN
jgi:hypothetical protein